MDNVDEQISHQTTIDPSGRSYTFTLPSTLYTDWQGLVHVEAAFASSRASPWPW